MSKCGLFLVLSVLWVIQVTEIASRHADEGKVHVHSYRYNVIQQPHDKVQLRVYYEALCPDCIDFHTGALDEVLRKIGSYLNYKSYPYGNAHMTKQNARTVVTCQHGELECYGNKLHACAIEQLQNPIWSALYNGCLMASHWGGRGSTDMDALRCGASMGVAARPIIRCAQSQRGEELLEYYGHQTDLVPNRTYVPYIIINGRVFDGDFSQFKTAVCNAFGNPPPTCLK